MMEIGMMERYVLYQVFSVSIQMYRNYPVLQTGLDKQCRQFLFEAFLW